MKSGRAARQRALALDLVRRHPGSTSLELSMFPDSTLDRYEVARHLRVLARQKLIREGKPRASPVGKVALTWWPICEQLALDMTAKGANP